MVKNNPIKRLAKLGLNTLASRLGPHTRKPHSSCLLVLMYHRVLPSSDNRLLLEEPGMTVTPETFASNLVILSEYFQFVKLSDWLQKKQQGLPLPNKACAITFDDGWMDNYEFAYPILKKLNIPATIFLVSAMIGTKAKFWPERLALTISEIAKHHPDKWDNSLFGWIRKTKTSYTFGHSLPTRNELSQIINQLKELSDLEIHKKIDSIISEFTLNIDNGHQSLLNWEQVEEMTSSGLIEAGSHTCHHTRLNFQTDTSTLVEEIVKSKHQIEQKTGTTVSSFCFPNGDFSPPALDYVRKNYVGAVTTRHGWNKADTDSHRLSRIGIHEDIAKSPTDFLARISGWV